VLFYEHSVTLTSGCAIFFLLTAQVHPVGVESQHTERVKLATLRNRDRESQYLFRSLDTQLTRDLA